MDNFNKILADGITAFKASQKEEAARIGAQAIQEYCQEIGNCCDCIFWGGSFCKLRFSVPMEWRL